MLAVQKADPAAFLVNPALRTEHGQVWSPANFPPLGLAQRQSTGLASQALGLITDTCTHTERKMFAFSIMGWPIGSATWDKLLKPLVLGCTQDAGDGLAACAASPIPLY